MSHTASKTWVSEEAREYETWSRIRDALMRLCPQSPCTPKTFVDWIEHRANKKEAERNREVKKIVERQKSPKKATIPIVPVFLGKELGDSLALVLARESIWTGSMEPGQAPWPTVEEFKHEGDDRNSSGYSRFPPLPRDPGNETVNWKQRKPLAQRLFDRVGEPKLAADLLGVEDLEEKTNEYIGLALQNALDD